MNGLWWPDDKFFFQAQNELCQNVASNDESKWPGVTEEGKWRTKSIQLPEGLNVLQWKAMGISGRQTKPLLVKMIQISGVPPLSLCTPCRNGTYSNEERSKECLECPANTYAPRGSASCNACDPKTTYSLPGSGGCRKRPPCTRSDYYEVRARNKHI